MGGGRYFPQEVEDELWRNELARRAEHDEKKKARLRGRAKLKMMGLTDEELEALQGQ